MSAAVETLADFGTGEQCHGALVLWCHFGALVLLLFIKPTLSPPIKPPKALRGGISKVNLDQSLSSFGDKCP